MSGESDTLNNAEEGVNSKSDPVKEVLETIEVEVTEEEKRSPDGQSKMNADSSDLLGEYLVPGTVSLFGAIANLVNSIIGSGVLSLPESNKESGVIGTLFLNISLFVATAYSLFVIVDASNQFKVSTLNRLFYIITGNVGVIINIFIVAFQASSACIAYYVIMSDSLMGLIQYIGLNRPNYSDRTSFSCSIMQNPYFVKMIFIVLTFVLLIPSKIADLTIISIISVSAVMLLFFCITFLAIKDLANPVTRKAALSTVRMLNTTNPMEMLNTVSVYAQAYICQFNVLPIRNEMQKRTRKNYIYLCVVAPFIGFIIYEFLGLIGYLQYGKEILGNITLNYGQEFLHHLSRISALIIVYLTFPVVFFAARKILHNFAFPQEENMSIFTFRGLVVFVPLYAGISILALVMKSLSRVLALTGSLFSPFITFIMPAMIRIFSDLKEDQFVAEKLDISNFEALQTAINNTTHPGFRFKKKMVPYYLLFILGIVVTCLAMVSSITKFISPEDFYSSTAGPLRCGVSYTYKELVTTLNKINILCNNSLASSSSSIKECTSSINVGVKYSCAAALSYFVKNLGHYSSIDKFPSSAIPPNTSSTQKRALIEQFYTIINTYVNGTLSYFPENIMKCNFYDSISKITVHISPKTDKLKIFMAKIKSDSDCRILDFNKLNQTQLQAAILNIEKCIA